VLLEEQLLGTLEEREWPFNSPSRRLADCKTTHSVVKFTARQYSGAGKSEVTAVPLQTGGAQRVPGS